MRVYNLTSYRTGKAVANQFAIYAEDGTRYYQSYSAIVCKVTPSGEIILDKYYWNYSKTTSKYLALFLGVNWKNFKMQVEAGKFKMKNLNK